MPVFEHVGFQLEHEQQDHPCGRVDGCRIGFEEFATRDALRIFEARCQPLFAEKQEDVQREQDINRVLEKLVQDSAVDFQVMAPPEAPPI